MNGALGLYIKLRVASANTVMGAITNWSDRTVFVTGCSGFVGCWLLQAVCGTGAEVVGLCRNDVQARATLSEFGLDERIILIRGSVTTMVHHCKGY